MALVVGVVALYPLGAYVFVSFRHRPKANIHLAGECGAGAIPTASKGEAVVAIENSGGVPFDLAAIRVLFKASEARLWSEDGAPSIGPTDPRFTSVLEFPWILATGTHQNHAFVCSYAAKAKEFSIRIEARLVPHQEEVPVALRMASAPSVVVFREVRFQVVAAPEPMDLKQHGLRIGPKRALAVHGALAKRGLSGQAERGTVDLEIHELVQE